MKVKAPAPQESHADEVVGEGEVVEGDRRERRVRRVRRVRGECDDTHSRDRWCSQCHRGDLNFIEIGVVTIGVETLGGALARDDLERQHFVAEGQRRWNRITADAGDAITGRADEHVTAEGGDGGKDYPAPRPRGRIPDDEPGTQLRRIVACAVGIVSHDTVEGATGQLLPCGLDGGEPRLHGACHDIAYRATDRVVKVVGEQQSPGESEGRAEIVAAGEGDQRCCQALQRQLDLAVAALVRCAGSVRPLQDPRGRVRLAQFTRVLAQPAGRTGQRGDGSVGAGDAHLVAGFEPGEEAPEQRQATMHPVMIGPDKYRNVRPRTPGDELRAQFLPGRGQLLAIGGEIGAHFVALRRQVKRKQLVPAGSLPPERVTYPVGWRHAPPQHDMPQAELAREIGQDGRMAESVGRVEHAAPAPETLGHPSPDQQVADERLAGDHLFVGEHVPGPDLQPPAPDEGRERRGLRRPRTQVVLDEDRLAIEVEVGEGVIALEPRDEVVKHADQAHAERRLGEVPLPVPVRMWNEVKDQPGHAGFRESASALPWSMAVRSAGERSSRSSRAIGVSGMRSGMPVPSTNRAGPMVSSSNCR